MASNPFQKSVILTNANQNYNLLMLMQALDPAQLGRYTKVSIQLDQGAGAANLFVGNEDVSGTNMGIHLTAGQAHWIENAALNIVNASQYWLRCDTAGQRVNVIALQQ